MILIRLWNNFDKEMLKANQVIMNLLPFFHEGPQLQNLHIYQNRNKMCWGHQAHLHCRKLICRVLHFISIYFKLTHIITSFSTIKSLNSLNINGTPTDYCCQHNNAEESIK